MVKILMVKMANGVTTATNVGSRPPVRKDQDPLGTMQSGTMSRN